MVDNPLFKLVWRFLRRCGSTTSAQKTATVQYIPCLLEAIVELSTLEQCSTSVEYSVVDPAHSRLHVRHLLRTLVVLCSSFCSFVGRPLM